MRSKRSPTRGFTLLEVMVATAILGLTLTVILSAEGGLAASNKSTANVGMAISLARCKMVEAEDKTLRFGFPLVDDLQLEQTCCNDEEVVGFKCDMRTELILMPNPPTTKLDGGGLSLSASATPSSMLSSALPPDIPGTLAAFGGDGGSTATLNFLDGGGLNSMLGQQMGGSGAGASGLVGMVMGFVYPFVKPMMEASIRRVTVTVRWKEGIKPKEFSIVQYLTNPSNGGFGPAGDGGAGPASSSSSNANAGGPLNTVGNQPSTGQH
jgi:general secretion pathway protein I